jgi:putative transposase
MTSKPVALLLADHGVTKTHARPHVSNDNPFLEAQFKTLKCTGRPSGTVSARSRTLGHTATTSSPGITPSTGTAASGS